MKFRRKPVCTNLFHSPLTNGGQPHAHASILRRRRRRHPDRRHHARLLRGTAFAQEPPPPDPVPDPVVVPMVPVTPATDPLVEAMQGVLDARRQHSERGTADLAEARALVAAASESLDAAERHLLDVETMISASSGAIVESARTALRVLEALIERHDPAPETP